jgi:hypothetical protein
LDYATGGGPDPEQSYLKTWSFAGPESSTGFTFKELHKERDQPVVTPDLNDDRIRVSKNQFFIVLSIESKPYRSIRSRNPTIRACLLTPPRPIRILLLRNRK